MCKSWLSFKHRCKAYCTAFCYLFVVLYQFICIFGFSCFFLPCYVEQKHEKTITRVEKKPKSIVCNRPQDEVVQKNIHKGSFHEDFAGNICKWCNATKGKGSRFFERLFLGTFEDHLKWFFSLRTKKILLANFTDWVLDF